MYKALFVPLQLSLGTVVCLSTNPILAQVTSDGTVNTQVNQDGNVAEITGGETRDSNLFHSFQDFSVLTGNEAFFDNALDISNIFSRVTGGNISSIDGLIRANGSASLFLINPAGILFGENASLNLGGSFYGSTSSSILFEDGEFSAVDNLEQPLLTVNAPIGLGFRDNPGAIVNRSFVQNSAGEFVGLEVNQGNTLALIGGDLNFEAGETTSRGGNIYLGGLAEAGIVNLNQDGGLSFPNNVVRANLIFDNAADIDVRGTGGGNIIIDARNLELADGEFGGSQLRAGILSDSTNVEAQAGDIVINATENIFLNNIFILNQVESGGRGNAGDILINANSLTAINGGNINTSTFGLGNAGNIDIVANENIDLDGASADGFSTGIGSFVNPEATGNAGDITILTNNISLTNGGRIDASTFGQGNAGAVRVDALGDIVADGESSRGFSSGIASSVFSIAEGNSGGVDIFTSNLILNNGARIDASTFGIGNAGLVNVTVSGNIVADGENSGGFSSGIASSVELEAVGDAGGVDVTTSNLTLTNGARIDASTRGQGNAGAVSVNASDDIVADGESSGSFASGIASSVELGATGNSGGVNVSTSNLTLTNGARIDASTFGIGNAGAVSVNASGDIVADGESLEGFSSGIASSVESEALGDTGGVDVSTSNLTLTNGARIDASIRGQGNAGAVSVNASGDIVADGESLEGFSSGIASQVFESAVGDSGGVDVSTSNLTLTNGARIDASTRGQGNAGAVSVNALGDIVADGESSGGFSSGIASSVFSIAEGNSGGVDIFTSNLILNNGARIDASTFGIGNAGLVNVTVSGNIVADGENSGGLSSGIASSVELEAVGDAGGVDVTTSNLTLTNGARIDASTRGQGNTGAVRVNALGDIVADGESLDGFSSGIASSVFSIAEGNTGGVDVTTSNLTLTNGARIDASTRGQGNAGAVSVNASGDIVADGESLEGFSSGIASQVFESAVGDAGGVDVSTSNLTLTNGARIDASTRGQGNAGEVNVNALNIVANGESLEGFSSGIASQVFESAVGDAGEVNVSTSNLTLFNGSRINSSTFGVGNAGSVTIQANDISLVNSEISSTAESNADGNAGNIFVTTKDLNLSDSGVINVSSFGFGDGGSVEIAAESLVLNNNASISSFTNFGSGGNADIQVAENLTLDNNSNITVGAFEDANGGNIFIDSNFIIAFSSQIPNNGNDIIAQVNAGTGGSISINTTAIFGMDIRAAIPGNGTNDISAGNESNPFDLTPQFVVDLPNKPNVVPADSQQTIAQACQANREKIANGGLVILGKGGIPPKPELPLNSLNIYVDGESDSAQAIPAPIETAQGKIQPARGIKVTKSGEIILTAYRTNNAGERIPHGSRNCGQA